MRILVAGGTGFIGQALCPLLAGQGHQLVVWTRQEQPRLPLGVTDHVNRLDALERDSVQAVVNLAGAGIADQRWNEARKQLLVASRVDTTRQLVNWIKDQGLPPKVLVSASAVGYYGEQGDAEITESTPPTPGFTHDLCAAWEAVALEAEQADVRVCLVRTGVVLDQGGGALARLLLPFRLGLGGPMGQGQHWMPWIHRKDVANIYAWLLKQDRAQGAYNASAPHPVTNAEFTRILGRILHRPALLRLPEKLLYRLFGELAEVLLASNRMLPIRLQQAGFQFTYPQLDAALQAILGKR